MPKRGQNNLIKKDLNPTPIPVIIREQSKVNTITTCSSPIIIPIAPFDTHTKKERGKKRKKKLPYKDSSREIKKRVQRDSRKWKTKEMTPVPSPRKRENPVFPRTHWPLLDVELCPGPVGNLGLGCRAVPGNTGMSTGPQSQDKRQ